MNGHSCAFLLLEVFRLFPESEGVSGDVFEDVLGIGEVTRGAFVGIRKRVHLMPNLKGSPVSTQFRASPFERALFSALNRVLLIN